MSSYIIAGSSDKVDMAECENMSNLIRQYYPDISFKIVLKDQTQWEQYADEVCRIYGFKVKTNPIIHTSDGKLIGDRNAFIALAESRFGIIDPKLRQGPITPDVNKKIAKIELDQKLKLQNNKFTLSEKVENQMVSIFLQGQISTTQGVFKQSFRNGMRFLYKFEDRLRPIQVIQETHSVEENVETVQEVNTVEIEVNDDGVKKIQVIEMFADNFLTVEQQAIQHQQDLIQKETLSNRVSSLAEIKKDISDTDIISPKGQQQITLPILENLKEELDAETQEQAELEAKANLARLAQEQQQEGQQPIGEQQQTPMETPNEQAEQVLLKQPSIEQNQLSEQPDLECVNSIYCGDPELQPAEEVYVPDQNTPLIHKIDALIVHKFKNDYVLFLHPSPLVDGQMILCKPDEGCVIDYSCIQRGRINSYKKSSTNSQNIDGLYEPSLDIYKCVTLKDCEVIAKVVSKCDGIAVLNVLPQELESFLPLSNGHINIIFRQHADLNKNNIKLSKYLVEPKKAINQKQLMPIEEFILDQRSSCAIISKDIYKIKRLDINHSICFVGTIMTPDYLLDCISRMIGLVLEKEHNAALKMGFNLIITKNIIFFCPTFNNYETINGIRVHLSALTSVGFLNLPSGSMSINYFELLRKTQERVN